jgi:hypothetical protein
MYVAVPRPCTVDTRDGVLMYVFVPKPITVERISEELYTRDPRIYAEFVKKIVDARMLPFTSKFVLG